MRDEDKRRGENGVRRLNWGKEEGGQRQNSSKRGVR